MMRRLTILGSGTFLPVAERAGAGYLVETDEGAILLDCGPGTLLRLGGLGVAVTSIDLILLSHFHLDHISDLGALLIARWIATLQGGARTVAIVGPQGTASLLDWVRERAPEVNELELRIRELTGTQPAPLELASHSIRIDAGRTGHTENSLCYRLTDARGRTLFYSGDTDYNESILPIARDADLAVIECSTPDDRKIPGHLTPSLAGRLAAKAGVKRLVLTHLYPELLARAEEIAPAVRADYAGEFELAADGRRHEL